MGGIYKVYIWGTGIRARELLENQVNATILGFIETVRTSDTFDGMVVYEPDQIVGEYDYIIVACEYADEIYATCINKGINLEKVVFLYRGEQTKFRSDVALKEILSNISYQRYMWEFSVGDDIARNKHVLQLITGELNNVKRVIELNIAACECNKRAFSALRACYRGKKVVLCGAGPSLNKFAPIDNAIYIALNRAILFDKVHFDYMFADDWMGISQYQEEIVKYDCKKFFGAHQGNEKYVIPETFFAQNDAVKYYKDEYLRPNSFESEFVCDIDVRPVGSMPNLALQVMQIALFMQPDTIYLVGCDASSDGHFIGSENDYQGINIDFKQCVDVSATIGKWEELKQFASVHYPGVEIVSVNPVGLKGLFKDYYQK